MKMQMRGKRFLAAMLAFVLAFTSMNFNVAAYADEIEEPATEVNEVIDEQVDAQASDDGLVKEGEPDGQGGNSGGATYSLRLSNCADFTEDNEDKVKFEYLVDANYAEADLETATWTTLYNGNRVDIPADKSVYVRVVLGEGQTLYSGEVRNGYDAGEGSPEPAALTADDIVALTGPTGIKYTPTDVEYVNLEFEHLSLTDNGGGQGGNDPGGQGGDPGNNPPVPPRQELTVSLTEGGEAISDNCSIFKEENKSIDFFVAANSDQTDNITLGWWAGHLEEGQDMDDIEPFTDSQEGISFTSNADGTAKITIPEVYDFDATFQNDLLWIFAYYTYEPEGAEPYTNTVWFRVHVRNSQKGLGMHDWLQNYSPEDVSTIQLGEEDKYHYMNSRSWCVNDFSAVLFGVCADDEALEDGSNVTPVTEGLTVKKEVNGKWTDTTDISLEYAGDRAGDPVKFAGLWLLEFKARGNYRIYDKDGNYVSIEVTPCDWSFYTDKNLTDASLVQNIAIGEGEAAKVYLALNGNAAIPDDNSKVAKLLYVNINEETFEWKEDEGKFSPELSEDYFTVNKLADGKYELSFGFEREYFLDAFAALEGNESEPYCAGMFVSQSYEGLVVNETIMFEDGFWGEVPTDFDMPEEYRKSFSMNDDETRWFGIGLNNGKQSAYDGATVTPVTSLSLLKLEKFDGEKYVKATDASLKYVAKNVFSFEGQEGEYRVSYNKSKDKYNGTCFYIYVSRQQFGFYSETDNEFVKLDVNKELTVDEAFNNSTTFYAFIPNKLYDEDCTGEIYVHYYDKDYEVYGDEPDPYFYYVSTYVDDELTTEDGKFVRIHVNCGEENTYLTDFFFEMRMYVRGEEWGYRPLGISPVEVANDDFECTVEIPFIGNGYSSDEIWYYMCDNSFAFNLFGRDSSIREIPIYYNDIPNVAKIGTYSGNLFFWGNFTGSADFALNVVKSTVADWFEGEFGENYSYYFFNPETGKIDIGVELYLNVWPNGYATTCPDLKFNKDTVYVEGAEEGTYVPVNGDGKLTKAYFEADPARFENDYYIRVTGQNNVEGEYYLWIPNLSANPIWDTVANGYVRYIEYTGAPVNSDELIPLILKDGNYVLKEGVDYTVEYLDEVYDWNNDEYVDCDWTSVNVDNYSYQIMITGKGFYRGKDEQLQVIITPADISKKTLLYNDGTEDKPVPAAIDFSAFDVSTGDLTNVFKVYDGTKKLKGISSDDPSVVVLAGKVRECPPGYDYVITFNAGAGKQTLTIEGVGNYKGMITKTIDVKAIKALTSKNLKLKEAIAAVTYTGQPLTPDFVLVFNNGKENIDFSKENVDIIYSNNVNAGTGTITVVGNPEKGYSGTVKYTFKINKAVIGTDVWVCMDTTSMYSPKGAKANIYLDDISGGDLGVYEPLVEGKDYKVTCKNNNKVTTETSKASYTITGIGNFTGTLTDKYDIGSKDVYVVVDELPQEYIVDSSNDATAYATINVKLTDLGVTLKKDVDYTWELIGEYADGLVVEDKSDKSGNTLKFKGSATGNEYRINFSGKGNYGGFSTYEFVVKDYSQKDISDKSKYSVEFKDAAAAVAGIEFYPVEQRLPVKVKDVSSGEEVPTDFYHVDYYDAFNAGTASVVVTGDPAYGYCGSVTLNYKITPMMVDSMTWYRNLDGNGLAFEFAADAEWAARIDEKGKLVYSPIEVGYVYDGGAFYILENKKDYTFKYVKPQAIHGADVIAEFTFKGNITGKVTVNMGSVRGINIDSDYEDYEVSGIKDLTYTGKSLKQNITVKDPINKLTFKQGKDLTVKYYKADEWGDFDFNAPLTEITEVGTYAISYLIKSKYALDFYYSPRLEPLMDGSLIAGRNHEILTFEVKPAGISKASVKLNTTKFNYNYNDVSAGQGYEAGIDSVKLGKTALVAGKDYQVTYTDNKKPGTATAVIEGIGNYTGSVNKTYTIDGKADINECEVYVDKTAYFGPSAYPNVEIKYNNEVLVNGKDYTLSATDNKKTFEESGKISYLTIKGKGKYTGTFAKKYPFKVVPGDLSTLFMDGRLTFKNGVHEESFTTLTTTYTGKEQKCDPKVYVDGKALKLNKDYTVSYFDETTGVISKSVVDAGGYEVQISGIGNYEGYAGEWVCGLLVLPADAAKMKVKTANRAFTTNGVYDSVVSVTYGGKTLVEGVDYNVNYYEPLELVPAGKDDYVKISYMDFEAGYYEFLTGKKAYKVVRNESLAYSKFNRTDDMNISAGKTAAYVVGIGNFTGLKEAVYTIKGYDMAKAKVSIPTWDMQELLLYMMISDGGITLPEYSVTYKIDKDNTYSLEMFEDFIISSINGIDVGSMGDDITTILKKGSNTVVLTGMGRFSGTTKAKMNVKPADISKLLTSLDVMHYNAGTDWEYYGSVAYNPNGASVDLWDVYTSYNKNFIPDNDSINLYGLIEGISGYKISYSNNKALGKRDSKKAPTIKLSVANTMMEGSLSGTFNIIEADVERYTTVSAPAVKSALDKNGFVKTYKSAPVVKYFDYDGVGYTNTNLKSGKDYTVAYTYATDTRVFDGKNYVIRKAGTEIGSKDKLLPGTSIVVTITGKGNYYGNNSVIYTVTEK